MEQFIRDQYIQVLTELESYGMMVFERNLGKVKMFEYDSDLVGGILKSIEDVPGIIQKKIQESKSKKFGKFDLGEKFVLVKKIFEILENSNQQQDMVLEQVKSHYFLGREIISELITHLAQRDGKDSIEPRQAVHRQYVYDFFYKNIKHFRISKTDAMYILDKFFNQLYLKNEVQHWRDREGETIGLKKLYPGETVKVKKVTGKGTYIYGDMAEVGLVYGVIFYKNGDVYAGHLNKKNREGSGWFSKSNGETQDGIWRNDVWVRGVRRFTNGSEVADFRSNNRRALWIFTEEDFPPAKLQKERDRLQKIMINSVQSGLYEGQFKGSKRDGQGTMYYSDASLYVGGWKNGLRDGKGRYLNQQGVDYNGGWSRDLRDGWGTMRFANGDFYRGGWKGGMMHGRGIMELAEGKVEDGQWNSNDFVARNRTEEEKKTKPQAALKKPSTKRTSSLLASKINKKRTKTSKNFRKQKTKGK